MGVSQSDGGRMEGWMYLIRSNRIGLQYSRRRYFILQDHLLKSFKSIPLSPDEEPVRSAIIDSCIRVTDNGRESIQRKVIFIFTLYNTSNHNDELKLGASSPEEAAKWIQSFQESALKSDQNLGDSEFASHEPQSLRLNCSNKHSHSIDWTVYSSSVNDAMTSDVIAPSPWKIFGCQNGLRLFKEAKDKELHGKWDDHPAVMAVGVVDGTSEAIFQTLMSLGPSRSEWDFCFHKGSVIEHLDGHTDIVHKLLYRHWLPWGMKRRDLLLRRYWRREDDGTYVILYHSVFHHKCPPKRGYVRACLKSGGYVISPVNQGNRSVVKHMLAIDWKYWKSYLQTSSARSITIIMLGRVAALRELFRAKLGCSSSGFSSGELMISNSMQQTKKELKEVRTGVENGQNKEDMEGEPVKTPSERSSLVGFNDAADEFFDVSEPLDYDRSESSWPSDFGPESYSQVRTFIFKYYYINPGLLLTLAGMGDEGMSVNMWGPSDLKYLVDAMKSFIPNAAMVHTRSFGPTPDSNGSSSGISLKFDNPFVLIDDEVVKISAILLKPSHLEVSEPTRDNSNESSSHQSGASPSKPGDLSVIYICELPEIKGKFDPKKAADFGLRPGPKFRELQLGNSVQSDRQNIMVHPSDVLGPSVPGPIVLLVDCPTLFHFQDLLSQQCLAPFYLDTAYDIPEGSKLVNCVIHLTPPFIAQTDDYQKWMLKFGAAQHVMAGHEMKNIEVPILKASARIAARLNYLCPQFFPSPGFWSLQNLTSLPSESHKNLMLRPSQLIPAENLLKFILRPYANLGLDRSLIPSRSSPSEIIEELISDIPEVKYASEQVNKIWSDNKCTYTDKLLIEEPWLDEESPLPSCLENITREEMEIVLLGTGSSQPSKYRNVSSIFINLFSRGSLLLDCGEGTLGQLKRRFGIQGADEAVRNLKCIWISHIHADHHTGLARILALRRDLLKGSPHKPIVVVGPRQLKRFLDAYQRLEDLDMQFLDCLHTTESALQALESNEDNAVGAAGENADSTLFARGTRMQSYWKRPGSPTIAIPILKSLKNVLMEAGLEALVSFPVVHCPQAFGVALQAADRVDGAGKTIPGWKVVYSGDTRPCPELVKASRGATILIHEATFEDSMVDEAIARNHSTTKEAVEVGDAAGVYRIILTHFSQRYPKIPVFDDEAHMHKTCIAFDLMSVNLADVHVLPKVLPHLKVLFRDEEVIADESEDVELVSAAAAASF